MSKPLVPSEPPANLPFPYDQLWRNHNLQALQALTLTQPWATLMAVGEKRVETRTWNTNRRGVVLIHAAASLPTWARAIFLERFFHDLLAKHGYPVTVRAGKLHCPIPFGAFVAIGTLVSTSETATVRDRLSRKERLLGNYVSGRYAYLFDQIVPLPVPVPWKGSLGFFRVGKSDFLVALASAMRQKEEGHGQAIESRTTGR